MQQRRRHRCPDSRPMHHCGGAAAWFEDHVCSVTMLDARMHCVVVRSPCSPMLLSDVDTSAFGERHSRQVSWQALTWDVHRPERKAGRPNAGQGQAS